MSLNDELQDLLCQEPTTSDCQQSVTLLQVLSTEDFRSLILSRDKINLQSQRVIIDQPIVIEKILHINCSNRSTLKFQGEGALIFRREETTIDLEDLQENNHNEICGCVFEVEGQTRTILVVDGGLKLMDCQLKSIQKMNLVNFNEYLRISSCTIEGFERVANFNGIHIDFSIENTMVNGGILLQCADDTKINEGKISIIKNKIKGGNFGVNLNEGIFTEITIYNNSFKNSQFGIQFNKCQGGQLQIIDNKVYNQSKFAIRLEQQCNFLHQLGWNLIEISGNTIGDSQTGIQLYDIQSNLQGQMDSVKISKNTIRNILQTALIIRDCLALHISDCKITDNVIGIDVSISTNHKTQCKINPFIITLTNCLINNNQVHGIFIHANLQQNPIYLLVSRCTFKFNNNILSMAHMGDESQENLKQFTISFYACHCEDNNNTYQNNPHFNISFKQTNIIMQKNKLKHKDNQSHCTLQ